MRSCCVAILMFVVAVASAQAQGRFGGQGGGPQGGGSGGFGGPPRDPGAIFDYLSKGRGFFLLTDTRSLREPLTKYSQEKGITDGKITREHFTAFNEQ
ncbi:MAG: hypothetical protein K2X38_16705, partial [Gemmataceae bacterium]|nr:hypothetical protein [Gemmataceae bacterium]